MYGTTSVATILALTLIGSSSFSPLPQDPQRASTGFVLDAGNHDLLALIERAGEYLGRNIITDPALMMAAGPGGQVVTTQKRLEVDALGCEDLLSQLLYAKGFALTPLDISKGLYEVIATQGPKRAEIQSRAIIMTPEEVLRRPNLKMVIVTSVPVEHAQVQVATNSLRPFFASGGHPGSALTIGNMGGNRAILLSGFADQVAAAIRLIRLADVPAGAPHRRLEDRVNDLEERVSELEKKVGR